MKNIYDFDYPWLKAKDARKISCRVCSGKNPQKIQSQFSLNGEIFRIMRCAADGLAYLSPQPGEKYCFSLYNHPTYLKGTDDMYGMEINDEKSAAIASVRMNEILEYSPNAKSIMEIGCGHGHLLQEALLRGFIKAKGIEFSKEAARICRSKKLDVKCGDLNKIKYSSEKFDVIAAFSVLEHLNNPLKFLKEIKKSLKPDGLIFIRVPETPASGPKLSLLDHFWHFNEKSIKKILRLAGFKTKNIFPSGVFQGLKHKGKMSNMTVVASLI